MSIKDRPRLGKGLKSLLSSPVSVHASDEAASASPELASTRERLADIPLALLDPNPHQPREQIDPVALKELTASIKTNGLLQPIVVRAVGDRFQLIAGHRRSEAAKAAGLTSISAIVRPSTEQQQAELALIENIQRTDLNPLERARAYRTLTEKFKLTHAALAQSLGEDRSSISNFLRLLDLNAGVQDLIARGLLSLGHAKILAGVVDPAEQDRLANRCIAEGVSVRKLEELVAAPSAAATVDVAAHQRTGIAKSAHIIDVEEYLSRSLGTRVKIIPSKRKNTGKVIIQYFSLDDFDRLVEKFK